jgi:hypothetical protein
MKLADIRVGAEYVIMGPTSQRDPRVGLVTSKGKGRGWAWVHVTYMEAGRPRGKVPAQNVRAVSQEVSE